MFKIFLMLSNYFHDLSVALLFSNICVVYFLGQFLDKDQNKHEKISFVFNKLKYVTYGAFAYVILGGILRAVYFYDFEYQPAIGKGQITALIVKHIFLFAITIFGIIGHRKYQKKYGN